MKMIKPIFLAHRGSWHEKHIENTIDAFDETLKNYHQNYMDLNVILDKPMKKTQNHGLSSMMKR